MLSSNYKHWKANLDSKTCLNCRSLHGKIYSVSEQMKPQPPLHPFCRCKIDLLKALLSGTATLNGEDGADWWLKNRGIFPA